MGMYSSEDIKEMVAMDTGEDIYDDYSDLEEAGRKSQECTGYIPGPDNPYPLCVNHDCEFRTECCVSADMIEYPGGKNE